MKKIYVAGASGWAGQEFVAYMRGRYADASIIDLGGPIQENNHDQILDLKYERAFEDLRAVSPEDVLVNFAGIIHPSNVSEFFAVNAEGLTRLFTAFAKGGGLKVVHVSSNSVLGFNLDGEPFTGSSVPRPYQGYGISKLIAEHSLLRLAMTHGLSLTILRVPWFHGGMNPPMRQIDFYRMVLAGNFPLPGQGSNLRSVLNVTNLAISIDALITRWIPGIYWLSDLELPTFKEYLNIIQSVGLEIGLPVAGKPFVRVPRGFSALARRFDAILQSVGFYNQKIHVIGELDQDIFGDPSEFLLTFSPEGYIPLRKAVLGSLLAAKERNLI